MKRSTRKTANTRTVRLLDAGWLWLESKTNLMHGGILATFSPPPGAGADFVRHLVEDMRRHTVPTAPFNRRLKRTGLGRIWPQWELVDHIDPDYHIHHTALPAPGGERELGRIVSQLQSTPLDKSHPLWTVHVIEGLEGGRFAVFGKMHHAMADGVAALGIVGTWLSEDPDERDMPPIWAYRKPPRTRAPRRPMPADRNGAAVIDPASQVLQLVLNAIRSLHTPVRALTATGGAVRRAVTGVSARPYSAPRTALNTPITAHRRVATQSYELARFQALAQRTGGTINDVVLAVCAGGLRRYLTDIDQLPERPLVTNIPVSIRPADSTQEAGNAISWAMLSLATDIVDVRERFEAIRAATTQAKQQLGRMPGKTIDTYTLLAVTPILLEQLTRAGGHVRPLFNVPISNVPGPRRRLYLNGAPMEEIQALTVIYAGQALNIVTLSYADRLDFSFTACGTSLPHVQRLSVYCGEALAELEKAFADQPAPARI